MTQTHADKRTYKKTLNLPKTSFSMKANLVQNEPQSIQAWEGADLYGQVRAARAGLPPFVFHDGPPYANGTIHLGHLLNKVLKDLVVRSQSMLGFDVPYVPGWDCHGLPIEHKVLREEGAEGARGQGKKEDAPSTLDIRRACRKYAQKYVKEQSQQMRRLLTLADYDDPYLTMNPQYEASVLEVFATLIERGLVYRGLKPVHWSIENQTALAEAELEYHEREDTSVYVTFRVDPNSWRDQHLSMPAGMHADQDARLMIWTTTPWTLPANMAVAVHPHYDYGLYNVRWHGNLVSLLVADELADKVLQLGGVEQPIPDQPLARFTGEQLIGLRYDHPFLDDGANRRVVGADYVTLDAEGGGTGLVHTAPGHGVEDYQTGLREHLDIYCPVRDDGTFDDTTPDWLEGKTVWEANDLIADRLRQDDALFHAEPFTHSYPHDWRGKTPVIFRATEQWFVAVDKPFTIDDAATNDDPANDRLAGDAQRPSSLRARAVAATDAIDFHPAWGRNRMRGMLESRPDWCISRQRAWGLPIPAFYPPEGIEGEALLTTASVRAVGQLIGEKGSDVWFVADAADLLQYYNPAADPDAPAWVRDQNLDMASVRQSSDIFDVWFESGSSWNACIRQRMGDGAYPTDLYLEGSDQHRGWFQLSLLPALGVTGQAPFRGLLTHGFMVDKDGRKMSKSLGNTLEVEDLLKTYGADVCRWWVASLNTDNDIKVDESFFKVAGEEYRKVRNTLRYLLSNLQDFNHHLESGGDLHAFTLDDAESLDAWVLGQFDQLIDRVTDAYESYQFRRVHEALFNFCNDTLSATYLAAVKDRLYCDAADSLRRRRTQTTLYRLADGLIRLLAPILPHTAEEAWRSLKPATP